MQDSGSSGEEATVYEIDGAGIVKGLVVPTPPALADGTAGDGYQALTDAILAHFRPSVNTTSERHKFRQLRQLRQQEQESVATFLGRLRTKVELCEFDSTKVDTVIIQ